MARLDNLDELGQTADKSIRPAGVDHLQAVSTLAQKPFRKFLL